MPWAGEAAPSGAAGLADLLQPSTLFAAYAEAKNLSVAVTEAGHALSSPPQPPRVGRTAPPPVHLALTSVTVEGYGSFATRTEYPLAGRGMLLLRGTHVERDAPAAAHAAAAGATDGAVGAGAVEGRWRRQKRRRRRLVGRRQLDG